MCACIDVCFCMCVFAIRIFAQLPIAKKREEIIQKKSWEMEYFLLTLTLYVIVSISLPPIITWVVIIFGHPKVINSLSLKFIRVHYCTICKYATPLPYGARPNHAVPPRSACCCDRYYFINENVWILNNKFVLIQDSAWYLFILMDIVSAIVHNEHSKPPQSHSTHTA